MTASETDDFTPTQIFATPLWVRRVVGFEQINADIRALLPQLRTESAERRSNEGGWHSQTNLHTDDRLVQIRKIIGTTCAGCATSIGFDFTRHNLVFQSLWININGHGHSNRAHVHPQSFLSGAYYVDMPKDGGNIELFDPIAARVMSPFPADDLSPYTGQLLEHTCREGDLLVFPGWLQHSVQRNESNRDRISISFNMSFESKPNTQR